MLDQRRNEKGRFLLVKNPRIHVIRVTPEEKDMLERFRDAEEALLEREIES